MIEALLGIPGKVKTLLDRLSDTRATNLDNINLTRMGKIDTINTNVNTTVSSRAAQTTADNIYARTDVATSTRASQASADTLTNRLSDQRALNLDNLLGVSLSELPGGKILTNDTGSYPELHQPSSTKLYSASLYGVMANFPVHRMYIGGVGSGTILNITGPGYVSFFLPWAIYSSGSCSATISLTIDGTTIYEKLLSIANVNNTRFDYVVGSLFVDATLGFNYLTGYLPFRDSLVVTRNQITSTGFSGGAIKWVRWA